MIDREKYITFKREELLPLLAGSPLWNSIMEIEIKDARVIRDQDVFAASAFYAYAHHIRGVMDFMRAAGYNVPATFNLMDELADYFMNAAECAEKANGNQKIPD